MHIHQEAKSCLATIGRTCARNTFVSGRTKCPFEKAEWSTDPEDGRVGLDTAIEPCDDEHSLQLWIPQPTSSRKYRSRRTVYC